ncbi:phosphate transporter PHO84 [Ascoidea rubescens DSM 1968]|uniref:Phosphate permease n=1 Tax=Ascoidea rubescens DSM 1968 TaxID=1344418 RepID=A0A1D2VKL0_9ASCO|nr:phosphate permease [Ascoidea rubescens DSM 1968]ODV62118.1 phosphate permease [Ascoidea rubescens DSM 1968]
MSSPNTQLPSKKKEKSGNAAFHDFLNDFADIEDPLERRRLALEKIDNAKFGWYHVRAICVGGVGFLTDSYDIFAINIAVSMLGYVYWGSSVGGSGVPSDAESTLLKVSTSVGTVIGQLGFGTLADLVGRKKIYGTELIIMIVGTVFQCLLGHSPAINFVGIFTFARIFMGIGIGADYPLSSIVTSEFATTKHRGAIMGAVFANQGWGQLLAGLVALICVVGWKDQLIHSNNVDECTGECIKAVDQMWRVLVGFGAVPAISALYFRLTMPESPRYAVQADQKQEIKEKTDNNEIKIVRSKSDDYALTQRENSSSSFTDEPETSPKASPKEFYLHFKQWKHGKILLGTAGSWFLLDVAFYGLGLNSAIILETIGFASSQNVYRKLYNIAAGNLILICAGSIPGYWFSVVFLDRIGRKPIQVGGFVILTAIFCIIGFAYDSLGSKGLLAMYVLAQFFQNFGPNATTFIVPGECFPTRFRSTSHGISAASGKIGAIIAQTCLGSLINHGCAADDKNCFLPHVMEIFALFMLLGIFTSLLIPETKRKTLEEIAEKYHGEFNPNNPQNNVAKQQEV